MIELWDFGDPWNIIRDSVLWLGSGGGSWPTGNEDQIRQLAADWRTLAGQISTSVGAAQGSAETLSELWGGDAGAWFAQMWGQVGVELPDVLVEVIGEVADSLDAAALDIEHSKLTMLLEVGIVITEIFVFAVMAWLSFGAAMAAAGVRIALTRAAVRQIFELLMSRAAASFTQRAGYAGLRQMLDAWRARGIKRVVLMSGNEAERETITEGLPQWWQKEVLGTRDKWDWQGLRAAAAGGGLGALGSNVGDVGRTLARKIDNGAVRGLANIGAEAASEWTEELLGNLGGSLGADGTVDLNAPGLGQTVAGMGRNYISNGARIGERVGDVARGMVGLETAQQRLERQTRELRENAAQYQRDAERAATQARAAADTAETRAQQAAAARDATRLAANERSADLPPSTQGPTAQAPGTQNSDTQDSDTQAPAPTTSGSSTPSPAGPGVPASGAPSTGAPGAAPQPTHHQSQQQQSDRVRLTEEAADRARVSADTAARQAQIAEQAAQTAKEAAEQAAQAEDPEEIQEAARAAHAARTDAVDAMSMAAAHAGFDIEPAASPDATTTTNPTGTPQGPQAAPEPTSGTARGPAPASTPQATSAVPGSTPHAAPTAPGDAPRARPARRDNAANAPAANTLPPASAPADTDGEQTPATRGEADASSPPPPKSTPTGTAPAPLSEPTPTPYDGGRPPVGRDRPVAPASTTRRSRSARELLLAGGVAAQSVRPAHYDPPTPAQERALDDAIPRDSDGLPLVHPPLAGGWTLLVNGGGPFQAGRHNNATEVARALASTWFGRPMVAGSNRGGSATPRSTEEWIGSPYVAQPGGVAGLDQIHAAVRAAGPGALAFVVVRFPGVEAAHELVVVNDAGIVKWADPVGSVAEALAPPYTDVESSQALLLDAAGVPVSTPDARRANDLRATSTPTAGSPTAIDEANVARAVEEAAAVGGGRRLLRARANEDPAVRRSAADEAVESRPGRAGRQVRPRLRYTIELPSAGYADAVRRTVADLAARGYQPVRLVNGWVTGEVGGVVSQWHDPRTGLDLHLRLDTAQSRAAYDAVRELQDARRSDADPGWLRTLSRQRQEALSQVRPPEGADGIRLPEVDTSADSGPADAGRTDDPPVAERPQAAPPSPAVLASWNDEQFARLPLLTGPRALQAVRDFVTAAPSGLEFTGDPEMRRHAQALRPEDGVLKIALHGLRNGEVVVGPYRMSPRAFAEALADLDRSGRITLGDRRIKLVSCYSAAGGRPPAKVLARVLRREVTGVTEKMWTYLDGTEVTASADVLNGRLPTVPTDGVERTFGTDGLEILPTPNDASETEVSPTPPVESGGGSRAGPLFSRDSDSDSGWRVSGDRWDSYRTPDDRLHVIGDRPGTFREPGTYRLHHELDEPGTYRSEDFTLRSSETGKPIRDPLLDRRRPTRRAIEGPSETYEFQQPPDRVARAVQSAADARMALVDFQETTLRPLMETLGISDLEAVTRSNLGRTLDQLSEHAYDPDMPARLRELETVAQEHSRLADIARSAEAAVPHAAVMHLLTDPSGVTGVDLSVDMTAQGAQPGREFLVARFDGPALVLMLLDTRLVRRSRHLLQDGSLTERGTPQYVRDVLETSPQLREQLRQNPDVLDELHRALTRGDLRIEFRRVEVDVAGDRQMSITTRRTDLSGLDLDGLADRLPPPSGAPDPALERRLRDSAERLAVFNSHPGSHGGRQITVRDGNIIEVRPHRGRPFQIALVAVPANDEPATCDLRDDGVYEVSFAANHLDNLNATTLDRYVARAIGHVQGEARATAGNRLGRLLGMHGGRLNSHDALVNDPTPGRRLQPSRADLAALAEIDALVRLHAAMGPLPAAVESALQTFIETRALREGVPGADARIELARRHLSEPTAQLIEQRRRWWLDSDPVVAGTRYHLNEISRTTSEPVLVFPGVLTIEPVPAPGRTCYRVTPNDWIGEGRLSFTFEVASGPVPDGEVAEFRGGGRERHFVLVIDPDRFELGDPGSIRDPQAAEAKFQRDLREALKQMVASQYARPGEVPYRGIDRLAANLPNIAGITVSAVLAAVLGTPLLVLRRAVVTGVDLLTGNQITRYDSAAKLERKLDRALAQLPDRSGIADGELQRRVDNSYDRAGDLATSVQGQPTAAERTVRPEEETKPTTEAIPEQAARQVRERVGEEVEQIMATFAETPIEFLDNVSPLHGRTDPRTRGLSRRLRSLGEIGLRHRRNVAAPVGGDAYELEVAGGVGVVVHVEVAHTKDPNKIEIDYTEKQITFRVSPDLAAATEQATERSAENSMRAALREALTAVASRQHELTQRVPSGRTYLARRAAEEMPLAVPTWWLGNQAISSYGSMQVAASMTKALVQALVDRFTGRRDRELADLLERHDLAQSGRLSAAQRRNVGAQIQELARIGGDLTRTALNRLEAGPHAISAPTSPVEASKDDDKDGDNKEVTESHDSIDNPRNQKLRESIASGIAELNTERDVTFSLRDMVDPEGRLVGVTYREEGPGRSHDRGRSLRERVSAVYTRAGVDVMFQFGAVEDGRPVAPGSERMQRNSFQFTVNVDADPKQVADAVRHIMDNILADRRSPFSSVRRFYEDILPALAQGVGGGAITFAASGSIRLGLLTGLSAITFVIGRATNRMKQLHDNDMALIRTLSETKVDSTSPQHLRTRIEEQRAPVEQLEQRAREIEAQLAADPRTTDSVARLRKRYGALPPADRDVLPAIDTLLSSQERPTAEDDPDGELPRAGAIARVQDADHTFRIAFKGAGNRPEHLTFEIRTGSTDGGATVAAYRVDSDVTYVLRVDPTQSPERIADAVRAWARQEILRISQQPTGLPSPKARWIRFARDTVGQALASGVRLVEAKIRHKPFDKAVRTQAAYSSSAIITTGSTELANISYEGNEAVSTQNRGELLKRHINTAGEEHLVLFHAETDALLARTQRAFEQLQHLEQIAADLPRSERPAPFRQGPRTVPGAPVAWGDAGPPNTATSQHDDATPPDVRVEDLPGLLAAIEPSVDVPGGLTDQDAGRNWWGDAGTTLRGGHYYTPRTPGLLNLINPFGGDDNCRACALAVDTTLSGAPMTAIRDIPVGPVGPLEQHFDARFRHVTLSDIIDEMTRAGHGARGLVLGFGRGPTGHVFNVVNDRGRTVFLDGQTGIADVVKWPDYMFLRTN
ncbi:toxin glutamine deamidase domain-containing protein [Micromonospora sp. NPDC049051]|uniref:toxin glutamine deamidase domain-containing protein n=1 Tax=Micromonospora sp. NPDC049051 TaxID=3364264 RepID=UPI0037229F27